MKNIHISKYFFESSKNKSIQNGQNSAYFMAKIYFLFLSNNNLKFKSKKKADKRDLSK